MNEQESASKGTVFWEDGIVKMIDQRQLPEHLVIAELDSVPAVAMSIREMYVRGAPAIGAAAALGMALAARASTASRRQQLLSELKLAKRELDAARPTAVNLSWATAGMLDRVEAAPANADVSSLKAAVEQAALALLQQDVETNRRMGRHGASVIPHGSNLMHHCNTGSLATVDIGTALGVIYACHELGKDIHVWVNETRPRLQGARLTAWELMRAEVPMHLVADNAAGSLMRDGRVDVVVFGADRVAANGDVANKIGTYNVAVLAQAHGIPVYCVAPTSTVDLQASAGDAIPIEERAAEEVTRIGNTVVAPANVPVYNPAFDITPHRYLTGIVTEEGICYPPFKASLARAKSAAEISSDHRSD